MTDFFIRSLQNAKHNAMPEITKSRDDGSGTGMVGSNGPPAIGRIVTIPPGPTLSVFTIIESAYSSAPGPTATAAVDAAAKLKFFTSRMPFNTVVSPV